MRRLHTGKMTLRPFPQEAKDRREHSGDLTHGDMWGPARVESLQKSKYSITFTDNATHRCIPDSLKLKSEGSQRIKEYLHRDTAQSHAERNSGR